MAVRLSICFNTLLILYSFLISPSLSQAAWLEEIPISQGVQSILEEYPDKDHRKAMIDTTKDVFFDNFKKIEESDADKIIKKRHQILGTAYNYSTVLMSSFFAIAYGSIWPFGINDNDNSLTDYGRLSNKSSADKPWKQTLILKLTKEVANQIEQLNDYPDFNAEECVPETVLEAYNACGCLEFQNLTDFPDYKKIEPVLHGPDLEQRFCSERKDGIVWITLHKDFLKSVMSTLAERYNSDAKKSLNPSQHAEHSIYHFMVDKETDGKVNDIAKSSYSQQVITLCEYFTDAVIKGNNFLCHVKNDRNSDELSISEYAMASFYNSAEDQYTDKWKNLPKHAPNKDAIDKKSKHPLYCQKTVFDVYAKKDIEAISVFSNIDKEGHPQYKYVTYQMVKTYHKIAGQTLAAALLCQATTPDTDKREEHFRRHYIRLNTISSKMTSPTDKAKAKANAYSNRESL